MDMWAIFLCDYTGIMAQPWAEAGYKCLLVDPQHEQHKTVGNIEYFGGTIHEAMPRISFLISVNKVCFVFGFPPCTDVAVSGSRHFESKRKKDIHFQAKAALIAEQCRMVGMSAGCPWGWENPVSVFSSIFGQSQYKFSPEEYGGYLPEDDIHPAYPEYIAPRDAYPKTTCIWSGGGFVMPPKIKVDKKPGYSTQFKKLGGKSLKTKNIRSATPRGFALAVFKYNSKPNDNLLSQ